MPRLERTLWTCANQSAVEEHLNFCRGAIGYDPALPAPGFAAPIPALVKGQEDAAMTMFFYHLNGLGYEAWTYDDPASTRDQCVQAVWRMVCFTYFPSVHPGCSFGENTTYKRPCKNSCTHYLERCGVECCDESPQCVFAHNVTETVDSKEYIFVQTGYADVEGPSAYCTGAPPSTSGAKSLHAPLHILFGLVIMNLVLCGAIPDSTEMHLRGVGGDWCKGILATGLVAAALCLQGCNVALPKHQVGNWRKQPDYLVNYEFAPKGQSSTTSRLNSCAVNNLPPAMQCSGKGYCKQMGRQKKNSDYEPMYFCQCDRDWADPECRTRRKSQVTSFTLSLLLGWLGIDYFYLGFPLVGVLKLLTLGGGGLWWLVDVIRMGSGPVYAKNFRVAADLPHWVFVLITLSLFGVASFFYSVRSYLLFRNRKRAEQMKIQLGYSDESHVASDMGGGGARHRRNFEADASYSGYGATIAERAAETMA